MFGFTDVSMTWNEAIIKKKREQLNFANAPKLDNQFSQRLI